MSCGVRLLQIPQELRDKIYSIIVQQIQQERCTLEGNPVSKYDGLRLSCRQLHRETATSIFSFAFTSHQLTKIFNLRANRMNFEGIRSVSIEIPFESEAEIFQRVKSFLVCMQLSLQEFRIFFVGADKQHRETSFHGCGNNSGSPYSVSGYVPLLRDEGQDFYQQWNLVRQFTLLRNLRILQIENANLPLIAGMVLNNKPHLKALSITSDPRSLASSFARMPKATAMELCRHMPLRTTAFPRLEVMSLCANSLTDVEGAVNGISPSLRHFSWRVPNADLQPFSRQQCFYAMTNRLMQTLSWRAPHLETLRLCISMRERQPRDELTRQEMESVTTEFGHRLPLFPALRHLEIHYRGVNVFFQQELVQRLPPTLSRLYVSDHMISITELAKQVRKRYLNCNEDEDDIVSCVTPQICCGELRTRKDEVPLSAGALGFINFEYAYTRSNTRPARSLDNESTTIKIMRLNGRLLDREHNFHLAAFRSNTGQYGIKPPQEEQTEWRPAEYTKETRTASRYIEIYTALYHMEEMKPRKHEICRNERDLAFCFEATTSGSDWDWYFGGEEEAMTIFEKEPAAKIEDQKQKPEMIEVEVPKCHRCRWASPEFELPAIWSFPLPQLPVDWREQLS